MHTFWGATSTNAFTTLASLSAGKANCGRNMGGVDLSAYWTPTIMILNADGTTSVAPSGQQINEIYYRRAGGGMGPGVLPFPKGLRMIAGNAHATSDQSNSIISWDCDQGGLESPHMYPCTGSATSGSDVAVEITFPSCWNGLQLDSADHKSHMAYPAANGTCPADHPVSLPVVDLNIIYYGIPGGPQYVLSSGGIYSAHADYFADWDDQTQNALVAGCLNNPHNCDDINLSTNGSSLFVPSTDPNPITINKSQYPTTSPWTPYGF
jgi:hypothetical protein